MFRRFYPTVYYNSAYKIDFGFLFEKGYRGLLADIDNTFVGHDEPCSPEAEALFSMLRETGWKTCFISNNDEKRVAPFAEKAGASYICKAGKPKSSGYIKGMRLMGTDVSNTLFIGDQLFTDIFGANNTGLKSILVDPVKKDHKPLIILKRAGEVIVKFFYLRYAKHHPGTL